MKLSHSNTSVPQLNLSSSTNLNYIPNSHILHLTSINPKPRHGVASNPANQMHPQQITQFSPLISHVVHYLSPTNTNHTKRNNILSFQVPNIIKTGSCSLHILIPSNAQHDHLIILSKNINKDRRPWQP